MSASRLCAVLRAVALYSACLGGFNAAACAAASAQEPAWQEIAPGVEFSRTNHRVTETGTTITVDAIRADPKVVGIGVFDTYSTLSVAKGKYADYSLRETAKVVQSIAAINGGFTQSFTLPIPNGLVIQDDKVQSPLNSKSRTQTGIFCISSNGARIVDLARFEVGACRDAVQSGPKIVEYPALNGISRRAKAYALSVVGIDAEGRVILAHTTEAPLFDIADILRSPEKDGGFGCQAALNLSGDVQSGLLYVKDGQRNSVGEIDSTIASVIAILPKIN